MKRKTTTNNKKLVSRCNKQHENRRNIMKSYVNKKDEALKHHAVAGGEHGRRERIKSKKSSRKCVSVRRTLPTLMAFHYTTTFLSSFSGFNLDGLQIAMNAALPHNRINESNNPQRQHNSNPFCVVFANFFYFHLAWQSCKRK